MNNGWAFLNIGLNTKAAAANNARPLLLSVFNNRRITASDIYDQKHSITQVTTRTFVKHLNNL